MASQLNETFKYLSFTRLVKLKMGALNIIRTALSDKRNATVAIVVTVLAGVLLFWLSGVRQLFANNPLWFGVDPSCKKCEVRK